MDTINTQLQRFKSLLEGVRLSKDSGIFAATIKFLQSYPDELHIKDKEDLLNLVCECFELSRDELLETVSGVKKNGILLHSFDPVQLELEAQEFCKTGLFAMYREYTLRSEPPLSYHLFCCLLMCGAVLARRVWFDMEHFKIYPNLGIIIIGPSGLKKTTATDIAIGMLRETTLTQIYAEKCTPEYLADSMKDFAQGVIYAPEMIVFLSRQRYMEGAIPLITRLLDCPNILELGTISRRTRALTDVAVSTAYCTTPDWLISGASEDIFTGGFMARHIMVVQYDTCRCEPIPSTGSKTLRNEILAQLVELMNFKGELTLTPGAYAFYDHWYRELQKKVKFEEHEITRTYLKRKHIHAFKVAISFHLANCKNQLLCEACFRTAIALLDWNEQFLPPLMRALFKTAQGADQSYIKELIRSNGGLIEHSTLLRKAEYRMNAKNVNQVLSSMKESGTLEEKIKSGFYHLWILKGIDL